MSADGSDCSIRECILTERLDEVEHDAADVRVTLDTQLALNLEVSHVDVQLPGAVYLYPAGNHVVLVVSCGQERTLRRIVCMRAAARRSCGAGWVGRVGMAIARFSQWLRAVPPFYMVNKNSAKDKDRRRYIHNVFFLHYYK